MTLAVIALLVVLLPDMAMAQAAQVPFGQVSSDDLSKKILIDYLFGPLTGAGDSAITPVVAVINAAVLFLGGVFMMYSIIAGTMATAHDGEILGRKWSAMWLPIRTALGAAAVMPVIGGGWCAAQALVVWLAMLGISIANTAWSKYATEGLTGNAFYNPPVMDTQVHQLLSQMLLSNVCVVAYESALQQTMQQTAEATKVGISDSQYGVYTTKYSITYSDGATAKSIASQEDRAASNITDSIAAGAALGATPNCGQVSLPVSAPSSQQQYQSDGTALGNMLSAIDISKVYAAVLPVQNADLLSAQNSLNALAIKIVSGSESDQVLSGDVASTLNTLTQKFATDSANVAKAQAATAANQNFAAEISKDGWINAGAFYMSIALAQDQITTAVTTIPSISVPYSDAINSAMKSEDQKGFWDKVRSIWADLTGQQVPDTVVDAMAKTTAMLQSASLSTQGGVQSVTAAATNPSGNGSWSDKVVGLFTTSSGALGSMMAGTASSGQAFNSVNQDPIIAAKNLGDAMLAWGSGALIAALVLGIGSALAPGIFTIMAIPFGLLYTMLIGAGVTLSFYLPMMPYILWLGVVFGWAVLLVEAVVAAPLWAVVHLAPDADGVVGRGGQGYMLVLSLTMRPVLMIAGLVFAIALMRPVGFLLNSTFGGAFSMATQGTSGWLGLYKAVGGCVIYAGVLVAMANRVFSLIHVIPDRLLRWIGGGGNELGSEAQGAERDSAAKAVAAGTAVREAGSASREMVGQAANRGMAAKQAGESKLGAQQGSLNTIGDRAHASSERADRASASANASGASPAEKVVAGHASQEAYSSSLSAARQSASVEGSMKGVGMTEGARVSSGGLSSSDRARADKFSKDYDAAAAQGPQALEKFTKAAAEQAQNLRDSNPAKMLPHDAHMIDAARHLKNAEVHRQGVSDIPSSKGAPPGGGI